MIKAISFFILICISACPASLAGESDSISPSDSIYAYSENDIPEVFFFPVEKARWNGSKVTMKEWYMLTDPQKEAFVSEYIGELENQYRSSISVIGLDYLEALNAFSCYSNGKAMNEPPTRLIDRLLSGQGKAPGGVMEVELWRNQK